jgi:acetyl esterase/lipase
MDRLKHTVIALGLGVLLGAGPPGGEPGPPPTGPSHEEPPPHQPAGPRHAAFTAIEVGSGPRSYFLYEPDQPRPEGRAPVVAFHHGWMAINPGIYGAWIRHLTAQGYVVIYPRYQTDMLTPAGEFLPNALAAIRDAFHVLETGKGRVRPDRERFALVGHSAGANLSAQLAAVASQAGLPTPKAVFSALPGEVLPSLKPDLASISPTALLVVVAAEEDVIVGDSRARKIFRTATSVPHDRKEFVLLRSDRTGLPMLVADHFAPTGSLAKLDSGEGPLRLAQLSRAVVDPIDTAQLWRLADATLEAGFQDRTLDESPRFLTALKDPGRWSDGRPVRGPLHGDDLDAFPRVLPSQGLRLIPWPATAPPPAKLVTDRD